MEFVIAKIEPKSKYYCNKYYPAMVGRECDIIHLMIGCSCQLLVDMVYDEGNPHRFYTTPVKVIQPLDGGAVVFETENSMYTLIPNVKD